MDRRARSDPLALSLGHLPHADIPAQSFRFDRQRFDAGRHRLMVPPTIGVESTVDAGHRAPVQQSPDHFRKTGSIA